MRDRRSIRVLIVVNDKRPVKQKRRKRKKEKKPILEGPDATALPPRQPPGPPAFKLPLGIKVPKFDAVPGTRSQAAAS